MPGGSATGLRTHTDSTYYLGNSNYECERIRSRFNEIGNGRFVTVFYNSQRFCQQQYGFISSANRNGAFSEGTFGDAGGTRGTLLSREFTGRTAESFCGGVQDQTNVSRCQYRHYTRNGT